ncbi:hypothetical protein RF11_14436 [Thelohanellus kitauei]|uniref:Uncharacterized protein n=1 Tax=Thelohanellus kitauei TaxID=669202 RepID=A0A0C2JDP4_THEKT|nr:hypothetical protein RF11_14436 [Thelohanellus kitauei]
MRGDDTLEEAVDEFVTGYFISHRIYILMSLSKTSFKYNQRNRPTQQYPLEMYILKGLRVIEGTCFTNEQVSLHWPSPNRDIYMRCLTSIYHNLTIVNTLIVSAIGGQEF